MTGARWTGRFGETALLLGPGCATRHPVEISEPSAA